PTSTIHPTHPTPTLLPYTTLFRSHNRDECELLVLRPPDVTEVDQQPEKQRRLRNAVHRCIENGAEVRCLARRPRQRPVQHVQRTDRKSTRLNSSHQIISYAVFCLK